jgi:hypothetical protein
MWGDRQHIKGEKVFSHWDQFGTLTERYLPETNNQEVVIGGAISQRPTILVPHEGNTTILPSLIIIKR